MAIHTNLARNTGTVLFVCATSDRKAEAIACMRDAGFETRALSAAEQSIPFNEQIYFQHLKSKSLGKVLYVAPTMVSTQRFVQERYSQMYRDSMVLALKQTSGKGRGSNTWTSPEGCLAFSFVRKIRVEGKNLPFLQYVLSLAVVQGARTALRECGAKEESLSKLRIKWPNDLYIEDRKAGGVLCNSTYNDGSYVVFCGIGLNVKNQEPGACLSGLLDRADGACCDVDLDMFLACIGSQLETLLDVFEEEGFSPLLSSYLDSWVHTGQKVMVLDEERSLSCPVVVQGLTSQGFLLATDDVGNQFELHPDGNSLDFFSGLVRRKV
mmetsp:Transcript_3132/g.19327  ORF Transcript_3132/g.19327 Transcript_3132/m.19327 type:complete len:324 (+) Transcript_3132:407-1378(+)